MNTKLSKRILASVLCLMMVFTLAFSSTEVLADSPSGNEGNTITVCVDKSYWERQGTSDVYVWTSREEKIEVEREEDVEATAAKAVAKLADAPDVTSGMKFNGWELVHSYTSFGDNFEDTIEAIVSATYTGEEELSKGYIDCLRRNTAGTYTEDPTTGERIPDDSTFWDNRESVAVLGTGLSKAQLTAALSACNNAVAVDGAQITGWTISDSDYNNYKEYNTPFEAKATYNKKSVNVSGVYNESSSYSSQDYFRKGVWVDEITDANISAELNKLNIQHEPNCDFQGWSLTKSDYSYGDADASYDAKANYGKQKINVNATYVIKNEDGTYQYNYYYSSYSGYGIYVTDTSDESIEAELNKLNLNHGLDFKGWEITSKDSLSCTAKARYDKYPSGLSYVYIDKNGKTIKKKSTKLYPADKKLKEIVNEETSDKRADTKFVTLGGSEVAQFSDYVAGQMSSTTLVGTYNDYRAEQFVVYPTLAVSKGYNYSQGKDVRIITMNYTSSTSTDPSGMSSWIYVPSDVDTTEEMVAFLQQKGLMGTLEQYQALVSDVKGFDYVRYGNMSGIWVVYANGSPSIDYNLSPAVDPSANHTLSNPKYTWSKDHKTCQVTYTCNGKTCGAGKSHTITYNCKVTSKVTKKATCTAKGSVTYTATSTAPGKSKDTNSVTVAIDSISHTYDKPVFTWSADGKTCTATYTCKTCNKKVTSKCKVTSKVKTKATCTKKGVTTYTATSGKYSSTKNVADIPINAKAHSYGAPVFKWSADGKTCTATYTCKTCNKKVTSKCKVTSKVKTKATCSKKGVTTYTATSGKYSSTKNVADIPMIAHTLVTKTTPATVKADGKIDKVCSVCNKTIKTTKINKIASIKVSNATYNKGQEVKPQVTVLDSKGSTINPKYYTVTYANNKEVGTGSVTVTFKGLYSGKLTKTFAINPKATAVAKASSPKKGQLAVNWKALPVGQTNGYQIQVSANANFKNAKTVSVGQKSKVVNAKAITGLKKGNYYIRIRTVKVGADGKTHYSPWAKYKNAVAVK